MVSVLRQVRLNKETAVSGIGGLRLAVGGWEETKRQWETGKDAGAMIPWPIIRLRLPFGFYNFASGGRWRGFFNSVLTAVLHSVLHDRFSPQPSVIDAVIDSVLLPLPPSVT